MQGHDAVVPVDCGEALRVIARLRIGCPVPRVAVAGGGGELRDDGVLQGEVQGDDRVAAVDGLQGVRIVAGLAARGAEPHIAAVERGDVEVGGGGLPDVHGDGSHVAAVVLVVTDHLPIPCRIDRNGGVGAAVAPHVGYAARSGKRSEFAGTEVRVAVDGDDRRLGH